MNTNWLFLDFLQSTKYLSRCYRWSLHESHHNYHTLTHTHTTNASINWHIPRICGMTWLKPYVTLHMVCGPVRGYWEIRWWGKHRMLHKEVITLIRRRTDQIWRVEVDSKRNWDYQQGCTHTGVIRVQDDVAVCASLSPTSTCFSPEVYRGDHSMSAKIWELNCNCWIDREHLDTHTCVSATCELSGCACSARNGRSLCIRVWLRLLSSSATCVWVCHVCCAVHYTIWEVYMPHCVCAMQLSAVHIWVCLSPTKGHQHHGLHIVPLHSLLVES